MYLLLCSFASPFLSAGFDHLLTILSIPFDVAPTATICSLLF